MYDFGTTTILEVTFSYINVMLSFQMCRCFVSDDHKHNCSPFEPSWFIFLAECVTLLLTCSLP